MCTEISRPRKIKMIFVQLEKCSESFPQGRAIEAHYFENNGVVALCTEDGEMVRDSWGTPLTQSIGDLTAEKVACRLALQHYQSQQDEGDFNRPIPRSKMFRAPC
jgi:hypothetical protein